MVPSFDWPDYGEDTYPEAAKEHVQLRYRAMVSMIDNYLGTCWILSTA
jgi:hypothetical protein